MFPVSLSWMPSLDRLDAFPLTDAATVSAHYISVTIRRAEAPFVAGTASFGSHGTPFVAGTASLGSPPPRRRRGVRFHTTGRIRPTPTACATARFRMRFRSRFRTRPRGRKSPTPCPSTIKCCSACNASTRSVGRSVVFLLNLSVGPVGCYGHPSVPAMVDGCKTNQHVSWWGQTSSPQSSLLYCFGHSFVRAAWSLSVCVRCCWQVAFGGGAVCANADNAPLNHSALQHSAS